MRYPLAYDETYIKVKGQEKYLYRAVDSTGQTIDFLLTAKRDAAAAKRFFRKAFRSSCNPIPRVINVDKNPAYPAAMRALKREGILPRRVRLRQCKYLNNIVEQDHWSVKKRTWLAKGVPLRSLSERIWYGKACRLPLLGPSKDASIRSKDASIQVK